MSVTAKSKWGHFLLAAFISGAASAIDSSLALLIVAPADFNLGPKLKQLVITGLVLGGLSGVKSAVAYLKQSPLPPEIDDEKSAP